MPEPAVRQIYIEGRWRDSTAVGTFQARNPMTGKPLPSRFPNSSWEDCDRALDAAQAAFCVLREAQPSQIADFLDRYATTLEAGKDEIVAAAQLESGLPAIPRLRDVELPRTVGQLRQAAAAARTSSWRQPTIDTGANIRSYLAPIGPVCVFGPSNFPLAFSGAAGGDFAAAIAAGNPVIAKAHPLHPETARSLTNRVAEAIAESGLPAATLQLLYHMQPEVGERLVSDPRLAATSFTGSRTAGLRLKRAADAAGRLIYVELSSVNPVVILPGALVERSTEIADEFCSSALMAGGQFCTNPGLVILISSEESEAFVREAAGQFTERPAGRLMSAGIVAALEQGVAALLSAGAELVGKGTANEEGFVHANTLLRVSARRFRENPSVFQAEAFGNASLIVMASSIDEAANVMTELEGNLTGSIYSAKNGADDEAYALIARTLRPRVGRLLNDKMPTGVAVSPAMNHGGPFPASGHPYFTAVGIPASIRRFCMLQCFDGVREHRLPPLLQDANPSGAWRLIDGDWTQAEIGRSPSTPL
jgi:alpha-ketoglutaric semialdehyde dehydrogenase